MEITCLTQMSLELHSTNKWQERFTPRYVSRLKAYECEAREVRLLATRTDGGVNYCLLKHLSVWATELQCTGLFSAYQTDKIAISCRVVYRVFQLTVCVISPYQSDMTTVSRCSLHSQILWYLLSKTWEELHVERVLKQRAWGKTRTGQTICLQCIHVLCFF